MEIQVNRQPILFQGHTPELNVYIVCLSSTVIAIIFTLSATVFAVFSPFMACRQPQVAQLTDRIANQLKTPTAMYIHEPTINSW